VAELSTRLGAGEAIYASAHAHNVQGPASPTADLASGAWTAEAFVLRTRPSSAPRGGQDFSTLVGAQEDTARQTTPTRFKDLHWPIVGLATGASTPRMFALWTSASSAPGRWIQRIHPRQRK
jgi:hypothetical protein